MMKIVDPNEMNFTEIVLSIKMSSSSGNIVFVIVKRCKTKEYEDGNADLA